MKWNFAGKSAIITGGASGIGRQIAMDMAENGVPGWRPMEQVAGGKHN